MTSLCDVQHFPPLTLNSIWDFGEMGGGEMRAGEGKGLEREETRDILLSTFYLSEIYSIL